MEKQEGKAGWSSRREGKVGEAVGRSRVEKQEGEVGKRSRREEKMRKEGARSRREKQDMEEQDGEEG